MNLIKDLVSSLVILSIITVSCADAPHPPLLDDKIKPQPSVDASNTYQIRDASHDFDASSDIDCDTLLQSTEDSEFDFSNMNLDSSLDASKDPGKGIKSPETHDIYYHGGSVMSGPVNVYYIWYGDWSRNLVGKEIMIDFMRNFGGSPYYNINTGYYSIASSNQSIMEVRASNFNSKLHHLGIKGAKSNKDQYALSNDKVVNFSFSNERVYVSNIINYVCSHIDKYSLGKSLNQNDIGKIITNAIERHRLPIDPNGVYFVLTTSDVKQNYDTSEFCSNFCGWHSYIDYKSIKLKYSFVGDPALCIDECSGFDKQNGEKNYLTPNNNLSADSMVSAIAHELEEVTSDPELNSWFDSNGLENADKCAWEFGTTYKSANDAPANMRLGNRDYMIQQNWVNKNGGYCDLK